MALPPLTEEQQRLAEEAIKIYPAVVASLWKGMPCLRSVMDHCDLESAAYVGVCYAARTYDKSKGVGISAYFGVAMKNAMLREIQKEVKSQAHSIARIPLEQVDMRMPVSKECNENVLQALTKMTEDQRDWIERWLFDGTSFRAFGRESGRDPRTAKKIIRSHLDRLKEIVDDEP